MPTLLSLEGQAVDQAEESSDPRLSARKNPAKGMDCRDQN
jgi:hypothetical protein